ncbi:Cof-type HAD-IIB family hydrolase [Heyndrickxia ginsengihumi]|uniref:Cof-type HAD-IIB family hydrolase n=1 Tax=Heyndrickxia ginsengihumi TaxID=363870 RepID=A0A0A6VEW7_9BACI|nr:Cof-type HAD-IIB family hydrolase [Heyndrickxia ginsengihumi]KHD86775.1 hypothetical protein NG54_01595 [Heyndrickxia ginsengihumi]MBE6185048.1 Cof-type HAD-IIB family hydrolase [Bacillus sp. (in: firmicutes)]NEY18484.1 Cof-type HAD-IIB family hydrolase [Heyndrickxia ginsengihumi]
MRYKIVFLDIDGTVLRYGKPITEATKQAVMALKDRNIHVAIATGRAPYFTDYLVKELNIDTRILFNGAFISLKDQVIYKKPIEKAVLRKLKYYSDLKKDPVTYLGDKEFKATDLEHPFVVEAYRHDPWGPKLAEPNFWEQQDIYQLFLHCELNTEQYYIENVPELYFRRWSEQGMRTCDVNPADQTKAVGIQKVLGILGIAPEEAVAFGDGLNDVEMLSSVGMGVAMGNARPEVKSCAQMVTLSVDDDGVSHGLKKLGLI